MNERGPSACLLDPAVPLQPETGVSVPEQQGPDDDLREIETSRAEITRDMAVRKVEA